MTTKAASDLGLRLQTHADILALIGASYGLDGLLLQEQDLDAAFYDLKTGLLGELFQKLVNYQIRAALVVPDPAAHGERFSELAHEHATHGQIRFVPSEQAGLDWLKQAPGLT